MSKKILFVVEMLRNGTREKHSYVDGVYDDELLALKAAWDHIKFRANKYGAEIKGYELNGGGIVYRRSLDAWCTFEESCKELAEKVKAMLDGNEPAVVEEPEAKCIDDLRIEALEAKLEECHRVFSNAPEGDWARTHSSWILQDLEKIRKDFE